MVEAELRGQVVLVTGASRGLGRALALAFARAGARVAVCARGAGGLEDTVTAVRALGGEALGRTADVTDAPAMRAFVAHVEARWGGVGALVNNASILDARLPLRDVELADWRSVLEVNLTGALIASQAVLPGMRARGTGSIINVSSGVANEPRAEWGAYAVSKAALEALTWNMAREEGGGGVRVNAVDPGRMRTPMRATAYPEEDPATVPEPSEVAGIFLWLASAGSTGVTGQRFRAAGWDG